MIFPFLTLFLSLFFATELYSQDEPDFVGEIYWKTSDGATALEKSPVQIKTKAGASVYL